MKIFKRKYLLEKIICIVLIAIIAAITTFFIKSELNNTNCNYVNEVTLLTDGWYVTGESDNVVTLPQSIHISEGDSFKISRSINDDFLEDNTELCFSSYYCDINIFLDNEKIYSYESQKQGIGRTEGYNILFAKLKRMNSENSMHELTIEYIPQFKLGTYNIKVPIAGDKGDIIMYYSHKGIFHACIAGMFIFIGVLLISVHAIIMRKVTDETSFFNMGIFSIICGIYLICQIELAYVLISNRKILYMSEFTSLALIGLPIAFILFKSDESKRIIRVVIAANILNFVVQIALYCLNIYEIRAMVGCSHVVLFISGMIGVWAIINAKEDKKLKKTFIALVIGEMLEVVIFYVKFIEVGQCIKISILIFIIFQVIYQLERYKELYDEIQENHFYQNLAYIDILTGISNRNSYENEISVMEKTKDSYESIECAVIDLNGLKALNDTHGHMAGDELIRNFGSILRSCLAQKHRFYRIGGDEFVIIFANVSGEIVEEKLQEIRHKTDEYNSGRDIKISYSIGRTEYNSKKHETITDMISEADEIMYMNKIKNKSCRV